MVNKMNCLTLLNVILIRHFQFFQNNLLYCIGGDWLFSFLTDFVQLIVILPSHHSKKTKKMKLPDNFKIIKLLYLRNYSQKHEINNKEKLHCRYQIFRIFLCIL